MSGTREAEAPVMARLAKLGIKPGAKFKLALRLYVPKRQVADGTWKPPAVQRVKS